MSYLEAFLSLRFFVLFSFQRNCHFIFLIFYAFQTFSHKNYPLNDLDFCLFIFFLHAYHRLSFFHVYIFFFQKGFFQNDFFQLIFCDVSSLIFSLCDQNASLTYVSSVSSAPFYVYPYGNFYACDFLYSLCLYFFLMLEYFSVMKI